MSLKEIYSQSYKVVKNNKVLWVLGLVVAAATASSGVGAGSNFNHLDSFKNFKEGGVSATTKQEFDSILNTVLNLVLTIPTSTWLILSLGVLTALIFTVALSLLLRSWAVGALIGGTYDALDERNHVSLATIGDRGLRSFKGLTGLYLVPPLLITVIFIPLIVGGSVALSTSQVLLGTPLIILSIIGLGLGATLIGLATLWAERLIAIENKPWTAAFGEGLRFLQNHFGDSFKLGISNTILGCGLGCGLMLLVGPTIGLLVIIGLIPIVGWAIIPLLIPLILLILLLSVLANALILTFKYVTWSALYKELKV